MSIATVKLGLACRVNDDLLPSSFGTDLLTDLIRELAIVAEGSMKAENLADLGQCLREYLLKLIGLVTPEHADYYNRNSDRLIPSLCQELYDCLRDELVTRTVRYRTGEKDLAGCINEVIKSEVSKGSNSEMQRNYESKE